MGLFDDLDLGSLFTPKPAKEEKKEEIKKEEEVKKEEVKTPPTEEAKEDITKIAKELAKELKPTIEGGLDDIFKAGQIFETPTTDYIREELVKTLKDKHEVEFRGITVTIDVSEDDKYDVFVVGTSEDDEEETQETESLIAGGKDLPNIDTAVNKAIEYLFKETGYTAGDDKKGKGKGKGKKGAATPSKPKEVEKPYEGPRTIKVWGRELYVETDPKVTEEQIKTKIATEYGLPEFASPDVDVKFSLDKATGILNVGINFSKRG